MTPLWSILILTIPQRKPLLARLMDRLAPQLTRAVCVPPPDDGPGVIGAKRQRMLEQVRTPYVSFFDDDDLPSDNYCAAILEALRGGPDVVGFRLRHFTDGELTGLTIHSMREKAWSSTPHEDGLYRYARTPNHLNPVRRELALSVGYKLLSSGEDADYSRRLFPLLKTEAFVDEYLYDYLFRSKVPEPIAMYDEAGHLTRDAMEQVIRDGGSVLCGGKICTTIEQLT